MSTLKDKVVEIIEIVKVCPENLQAACFELLMQDLLASQREPAPKLPHVKERAKPSDDPAHEPDPVVLPIAQGQDDIVETDLHTKTRYFMKKFGVTIEELNNLYYREGEAFEPLYEDLKTTKMAEGQMRIAMLQSLRNALVTGDFQTETASVRSEAALRKCLDTSNFSRNFNTNAGLFDFGEYSKDMTTVRLSEAGKESLAKVIKELQ